MKPTLIILFLLLLLVRLTPGNAQSYPVKKYTEADGLASATVYRIMQDKKGFLFFSTDNGISIFNGREFSNYASPKKSAVMSVAEMADGNELVSTVGGLYLLQNDSLRSLKTRYPNLPDKILYAEPDNGRIWVITAAGLQGELFCIDHDSVKHIRLYDEKHHVIHTVKMKKDPAGQMFFCTGAGLFTADSRGALQPFLRDLVHEAVCDIAFTGKDIWAGLQHAVIFTDQKKLIASCALPNSSGVSKILPDDRGNIWVICEDQSAGLIKDGHYTDITDMLPGDNIVVNDIFEDDQNNIWLATNGIGAYRLAPAGTEVFYPYKGRLNVYAKALASYRGQLLAGSFGTVSFIRDKEVLQYKVAALQNTDFIYFLHPVGADLYVGTPRGLIKKNMITGGETFLRFNAGVSFCPSAKGFIYTGGFAGLGILQNDQWHPVDLPQLNKRKITALFEERDQLWIGTDSGLYVLANNSCRRITEFPFSPAVMISAIIGSPQTGICITGDEGFAVKKNQDWKIITSTNGGINGFHTVINFHDTIWVGGQQGLFRFDEAAEKLIPYAYAPGEAGILSLYGDSTGITAGTVNGIYRLRFPAAAALQAAPRLYITAAKTGTQVIDFPSAIRITDKDVRLVIRYIGLNYRYPQNVEYGYRITQADEEWKTTQNTSVELPLLAPGKYSFELRCRLRGGDWGNTVHLEIEVPVPFQKTWWFLLCRALLLAALMFAGIRAWLIAKQKKYRADIAVREKMNHFRQQVLTTLINPHFIFNCLNSIQYYINRNDRDNAGLYMSKFGSLIRLTIEHAQETFITLSEEVERLTLYLELEKLRCGPMLQYSITIAPALQSHTVIIPNMIVQPFVENAIWHGIMPKQTAGNLLISAEPSSGSNGNKMLLIKVADDGVGIKENNASAAPPDHLSVGMKLTAERVELLTRSQGAPHTIRVINKKDAAGAAAGTIIEIEIPLVCQ